MDYQIATPLRDSTAFSKFYIDSWPTLTWKCGFDIAPESLYFMVTGKTEIEAIHQSSNLHESVEMIEGIDAHR